MNELKRDIESLNKIAEGIGEEAKKVEEGIGQHGFKVAKLRIYSYYENGLISITLAAVLFPVALSLGVYALNLLRVHQASWSAEIDRIFAIKQEPYRSEENHSILSIALSKWNSRKTVTLEQKQADGRTRIVRGANVAAAETIAKEITTAFFRLSAEETSSIDESKKIIEDITASEVVEEILLYGISTSTSVVPIQLRKCETQHPTLRYMNGRACCADLNENDLLVVADAMTPICRLLGGVGSSRTRYPYFSEDKGTAAVELEQIFAQTRVCERGDGSCLKRALAGKKARAAYMDALINVTQPSISNRTLGLFTAFSPLMRYAETAEDPLLDKEDAEAMRRFAQMYFLGIDDAMILRPAPDKEKNHPTTRPVIGWRGRSYFHGIMEQKRNSDMEHGLEQTEPFYRSQVYVDFSQKGFIRTTCSPVYDFMPGSVSGRTRFFVGVFCIDVRIEVELAEAFDESYFTSLEKVDVRKTASNEITLTSTAMKQKYRLLGSQQVMQNLGLSVLALDADFVSTTPDAVQSTPHRYLVPLRDVDRDGSFSAALVTPKTPTIPKNVIRLGFLSIFMLILSVGSYIVGEFLHRRFVGDIDNWFFREHLPQGVLILDKNDQVLEANERGRDFLSIKSSQLPRFQGLWTRSADTSGGIYFKSRFADGMVIPLNEDGQLGEPGPYERIVSAQRSAGFSSSYFVYLGGSQSQTQSKIWLKVAGQPIKVLRGGGRFLSHGPLKGASTYGVLSKVEGPLVQSLKEKYEAAYRKSGVDRN